MLARRSLTAFAVVALATLAACSGSPDDGSDFERPVGRGGEPGSGSTGAGGDIGGDGSSTPGAGPKDSCATSSAQAEQLPLHMVVVLDKSGSMCEYTSGSSPRNCGNANSKWQQVSKALDAFFSSAQSKGISVSLIAFPVNNNTCSASAYQAPIAADVVLPDTAKKLSGEIGKLDGDGSTPTRYALEGAINYAKTVETKLAGKGKVAVVMATDGYPQDCNNNSIGTASTVASAAKATIPTYVIGVGDLLGNLDALAAAGGTTKALAVSTSNSAMVGDSFAAALAKIRGASLACAYALPAAPAGETLDLKKVNIQYTGGGASITLDYDPTCAAPNSWRYDNATAPTKIELCTATCDRAKTDATAKIDVVLGCETKSGDVR